MNHPDRYLRLLFLSIAFILSLPLTAQQVLINDQIHESREANLRQLEQSQFVAGVISGRQYFYVKPFVATHHHFAYSTEAELGNIQFEGVLYENQMIQYDAFRQKVVILQRTPKNSQYIGIDHSNIDWFTMGDKVHITYEDSVLERRIYQEVYQDGTYTYLIHHKKVRYGPKIEKKFGSDISHYLLTPKGTFSIKSKKDILSSFNKPKEIKELLKEHKIQVRKNNWAIDIPVALAVISNSKLVAQEL